MNIEDFVPYDIVKSVEIETHVAAIESTDLSNSLRDHLCSVVAKQDMHKRLYRIVISFDLLKLPVNPVLEGIIFSRPTKKCKDIVENKI